jgi:beta-glucosidase
MYQAMALEANLLGYSHWSLLDNWEWGDWGQPYGLAAVDFKTFDRTLKPSERFYGALAKENGFTAEIARRYL